MQVMERLLFCYCFLLNCVLSPLTLLTLSHKLPCSSQLSPRTCTTMYKMLQPRRIYWKLAVAMNEMNAVFADCLFALLLFSISTQMKRL